MKTINHFGLSGGKDSTALWGWAINESGYPKETIRGSSSDTHYEYPETYEQIRKLNEYGISHGIAPIRILETEGFLNLALRKGRFPSAKARFCTEHLKMIPLRHYIEEMWLDGCDIVGHSGVRKSESIERSLMLEWGQNNGIKIRRPLLEWSIKDVWDAHRRYGLPINPLYLQGRKRVGCRLCIMSNKYDVRITVKHHPEVIEEIAKWEQAVGDSRASRGIVCDYSSLFHRKSIPESQRSRDVMTQKGPMMVATIDDVARWSQTLRGGTQSGFDFMFEEDDWNDFDATAACQSGYCE